MRHREKPAAADFSPMRIGLLDHLGTGNLGDDATLAAVMQQIKARWPSAVMIGLSLDPSDTAARHGIPAYAIRRGFQFFPELKQPTTSVRTDTKDKRRTALGKSKFLFRILRVLRRLLSAIADVAIRQPLRPLRELSFLLQSFRVTRSLDLLIICGGGQLLDAWGGPWQFPYTLFKWVLLC